MMLSGSSGMSRGMKSAIRFDDCSRRMITAILMTLLLSSLVGCGFQLRGTGQTTSLFETAYLIPVDPNGDLARALLSALSQSGVELTSSSLAQVSIQLDRERFSRRPVSTTGQVNVAEYELSLEVAFEVQTQNGDVLIPPTKIKTERIYTFDSSSLVSSNEEESLINEEMRRDVVSQLIQRINASIRTGQSATEKVPAV